MTPLEIGLTWALVQLLGLWAACRIGAQATDPPPGGYPRIPREFISGDWDTL